MTMHDKKLPLCRYDLNDWLGFKLQMNLAPEAGVSQGMLDVDVKVGLQVTSQCNGDHC